MRHPLYACLQKLNWNKFDKTYKTYTFIYKTGVSMGINYFLLFLRKIIGCGYSLEPPRRGGCNGYPQSMF